MLRTLSSSTTANLRGIAFSSNGSLVTLITCSTIVFLRETTARRTKSLVVGSRALNFTSGAIWRAQVALSGRLILAGMMHSRRLPPRDTTHHGAWFIGKVDCGAHLTKVLDRLLFPGLFRPQRLTRRGGWCSSPSGFFWRSITQKNEERQKSQKNPEEKPPPCPLLPLYKPPKRQVTSSGIALVNDRSIDDEKNENK